MYCSTEAVIASTRAVGFDNQKKNTDLRRKTPIFASGM